MDCELQEMDLCVTNRCNLSCSFCSESAGKALAQEMPLERQLSLIREAAEFGLKSIHFSGGEPTMHPGLVDMISTAAKCGIHNRIITNGYRLSWEKIRRFKDAGLDCIMFSVDGLESSHNSLRGSLSAYHDVMNAVVACIEEGIMTRVNMVIWKSNVSEIIPLLKECETLGAHIFSAFMGCPTGRGKSLDSMLLNSLEWRDALRSVESVVQTNHTKMQVVLEKGDCWPAEELVWDPDTIHGCGAGCSRLAKQNEYIIVRADGNVYPCVFFMESSPPLTSVSQLGLEQAFKEKPGLSFYERIAQPVPECDGCEYVAICNSGCRGYAYGVLSDFFRKDPRCTRQDDKKCSHFPICPIMKINLKTGSIDGSTDAVI